MIYQKEKKKNWTYSVESAKHTFSSYVGFEILIFFLTLHLKEVFLIILKRYSWIAFVVGYYQSNFSTYKLINKNLFKKRKQRLGTLLSFKF